MNHYRSQFLFALLSLTLFGMAACAGGVNSSATGSTPSNSSGSGSGGSGSSGSGSGSSGSGSSGSSSSSASATPLASLTGSNTAACPASGTLPVYCQTAYTGQKDTRAEVETPEYDAPAGNVSDEDLHGYLTQGSKTKIYANMMLGYCIAAGSAYCDNNVETGYTSDDANTIAAQAADMMKRHIDGGIMTWEGPGTSEDQATLLFQSYANTTTCGARGCTLGYMLMDDGPSRLLYSIPASCWHISLFCCPG